MPTIKKYQIEPVLIQIEGQIPIGDGKVKAVGLLNEDAGLGLKRKLRKIQKELFEYLAEFRNDMAEVDKIEDKENNKSEREKLINEEVVLKSEKVMIIEIEKITSEYPYDFDLIELIAE